MVPRSRDHRLPGETRPPGWARSPAGRALRGWRPGRGVGPGGAEVGGGLLGAVEVATFPCLAVWPAGTSW